MTTITNTKTFGKAAKKMIKTVFPTAKKMRIHGSNKMSQYINFYDNNDVHVGYWTNERREKGIFRAF